MAKNDNRDKQKQAEQRLGVKPNTDQQAISDEWRDDEVEAEVESTDAAMRERLQKQNAAQAEVDAHKQGFFEKAKSAVKHALHIDTPDHMHHATAENEDPEHRERIREAHKVDLGEDGAELKGLPLNKVPGKLRKFMSDK